jgi:chloramphenicol O-acetyltransferase type A
MTSLEKEFNIENWKRKEHFEFYSKYDEPFWGIVSEIDVTIAYKNAKEKRYSFFLYYLHKSILAINKINEFKYRIKNGRVIIFDEIHAASTIGRKDETFGYSFIEFSERFKDFTNSGIKEIERINSTTGLSLNENSNRLDVIHYSTLPWLKFTGLTHARNIKNEDSIPKIVFGKAFESDGRMLMNISLNAHHGLADGLHGAKFYELFQKLMDT